jgi:mycothiol maleylpyruvate isomerase-like protein
VRDIAGHVLGMMQRCADPAESQRQDAAAKARAEQGENWLDALTDTQVRSNAALSTTELLAVSRQLAPVAAARRTGTTEEQRAIPYPVSLPGEGDWTLGYLLDCILTRDAWMHRLDIARALDRPVHLTAEHDGAIVADVVAEWARRHGQPFELELTGPAGGVFAVGEGGTSLQYDATEFCWILSGRASAPGLMSTHVPF